MQIKCPYCDNKFELEAYLKDSIMVQVIRLLPDFGGHGRLAWEYAELFHIGPPLNARKLYRVLAEISGIFKDGGFDFQKRRYEISRDGLARALRAVCDARIVGGLSNHNYLKRVAIKISEEEAEKRGKEDERELRKREKAMANGQWSMANGQRDAGQAGADLGGDAGGKAPAGNLGPLIRSFVEKLESGRGRESAAEDG